MPRFPTTTIDDASSPPPPPRTAAEEMNDTLRQILAHLERMDRRDRVRTWGGFVRTLISIVPMAIFILSTWYLYANMDEILSNITKQAAERAAAYSRQNSQEFLDNIKNAITR